MSQAFMKTGATPQDVTKATASINKKVYFAGDYANYEFMGTATGAYLSGIDIANQLLNDMRMNSHAIINMEHISYIMLAFVGFINFVYIM